MINSPSAGRILFDAVLHVDHSLNVVTTDHPVQTGANISDHAYKENDEVTLEIGMSDAAVSSGGSNRSVNAYQTLRSIAANRELVTLVTRLNTYPNMLIVSLSAPDDYTTMFGLRATVSFKQIKIVSVSTVQVQQTVSADKPTAPAASSGGGGGSQSAPAKKTPSSPKPSTPKKKSKKKSVLASLAGKAKTNPPVKTNKSPVKASSSKVRKIANTKSKFKKSKYKTVALKA